MTQSGGPEAFDTYKAEAAPDFLAGFDAVANKDAWGEATKMMKLNNKQRLENAKIGQKVLTKAEKLSPTLAKAYKVHYDNNEEIFKNRAINLANKTGANQEDYTKYQRDNEDNIKSVSYFEQLAIEQDTKGTLESRDLAKELRALHGRRLYHMKENMAREQALSARRDFYEDLPDLRMPDPNVEGSFLTWNDSDNSERELLWNHWLETKGLTNVNGLDDKFLADNYWKFVNRERDAILGEASENDYRAHQKNEADQQLYQFTLAAGTDNLASKFLETIELTRGKYLDARGQPSTTLARKAVIGTLDQMLTDEKITPEQYKRLVDTKILNRATGKMQAVGEIWHNDFGNIDDRINIAIEKRHTAETKRQNNLRNEAGKSALAAVKENGGYISEAEVAELYKAWKANPETAGIPVPEQYEILKDNTIEDKSDAQLNEFLQAREDQGLPLGSLWTKIKDKDMREEWAEKSRLDGETTNARAAAVSQLGRIIDTHWTNKMGVAGRGDQWGITYRNAFQGYRSFYREAAHLFPGDPYKRQEWALQQVQGVLAERTQNENGMSKYDIVVPINIGSKYRQDLDKAVKTIKGGSNNGLSIITSNQIIPGTEDDFKILEHMMTDAGVAMNDIPAKYYAIAAVSYTHLTLPTILLV